MPNKVVSTLLIKDVLVPLDLDKIQLSPLGQARQKLTDAVVRHVGLLAQVVPLETNLPRNAQGQPYVDMFLFDVYDGGVLDDATAREMVQALSFPELNVDWCIVEVNQGGFQLRVSRRSGGPVTH